MSLPQIRTGVYTVADMTIEEMLAELYAVSFPDLYCSNRDGKWWAQSEMRIKVQGATFKITSEMNHAAPDSAIRQLLERVRAAMKQLGGYASCDPRGAKHG